MTHYASGAELSRLFGWSEAYIRKLASVHRWRRRGRHPVEYHLTDVAAYRGQHPPRRRAR